MLDKLVTFAMFSAFIVAGAWIAADLIVITVDTVILIACFVLLCFRVEG
jgi:hypothetical protein